MFVWIVHRISGAFLIALLGLKMLTGYFLMTRGAKPDWALTLHINPLADILLALLVVFHAFYGLRTILYDLGLQKEKGLFWTFTALSVVVSGVLIFIRLNVDY